MMTFEEVVAERVADKLLARLEDENALPLPARLYDVRVDDPDLSKAHDFTCVSAVSARAAAVHAYRLAARAEGFRLVVSHPQGDELTVESEAARAAARYCTVHRQGRHPQIQGTRGRGARGRQEAGREQGPGAA